jgi:hypothetical protein
MLSGSAVKINKNSEEHIASIFSVKDNMSKKQAANWMLHTRKTMLGTSLGKGPEIINWGK